jgi:peptide chain release factor 1
MTMIHIKESEELIREKILETQKKIKEAEEILEKEKDKELISLAQEELNELKKEKENLENLLKENQKEAPQGLIIEIRAGTGGEEAALFASDLFKMYSKYINSKGWKLKVLDIKKTSLDGLRQIVFEVSGNRAYDFLKYEGGVHRVQRIPKTEKSGRIHTSTVSVAVLVKPKPKEIKINPSDLKIEFYRASGPGGQYVNKRETAVRITHLPTGLIVTSQVERNQLENRKNALSLLEAKLFQLYKEKEEEKLSKERRSQIKWARRADKIRTYNFPQNRVTDHRIKKSWNNLDEIIEGNLDPIIESLLKISHQSSL